MQRSLFTVNVLLMGAALLAGNATAQQTPTVPAKTQTGTATKTRHTTTATKPKPLVLSTQKDKASYAIGLNIGKGLSRDAVDVDPKIVLKGLEDALSGSKPLLTEDEVNATLMALQEDLRKKQEEKRQALIETNKAQGVTFLAANSKKDGVVTLPSGLQYKILTAGTGPKPTADDTVVCNYRGTLLDNTEFDSSYKRGQPASFAVNRVIKGWTEALQLMPVGSKWQLFIPADLAYGERGQGPVIGPNATLVFEVELLSIQDKPQAQTPAPQQTPPPQ
jgi:FKBP-type peptidyl-prolyl cis-trans isomerase FklB